MLLSLLTSMRPRSFHRFAAGLVHSCLSPLSLLPWSLVARRCTPSFRPLVGAEAEAPVGLGVVPDFLFFHGLYKC
jgi:hypothetical protein